MSSIRKRFDNYRIYYMTGGAENPLINCYDGDTYVGKLCFHDEDAPLPPNAVVPDEIIYLRYKVSQFNDVVGMLRNESPLFLRISEPSLIGYIGTSEAEPVGEEESL